MEKEKTREVKIEDATLNDLSEIMNIMHTALGLVEDKSWYAVDGEEFVAKCIEGQGFTLKAMVDGNMAGFLTIRYPWKDDDILSGFDNIYGSDGTTRKSVKERKL